MYDTRQILIIGVIALTFAIANGPHALAGAEGQLDLVAAAIGALIGAIVAGILVYEVGRRVSVILTRAQLALRQ